MQPDVASHPATIGRGRPVESDLVLSSCHEVRRHRCSRCADRRRTLAIRLTRLSLAKTSVRRESLEDEGGSLGEERVLRLGVGLGLGAVREHGDHDGRLA